MARLLAMLYLLAASVARRALKHRSGAGLAKLVALGALLAHGAAFAAPNPLGLKVTDMALTSEVRVGRTTYEYTYRVNVANPSAQGAGNVIVTVGAPGLTGTTITDGSLNVGTIAAGRSATSTDTFTLVQDRLIQFDRSRLVFDFTYDVGDRVPDVAGLSLADARVAIVAAGYRWVDGNEILAHSDTVAVGLASGTQPPAGTLLARSSEVRIVLSLGPEDTSGLRISINPASVSIPQGSGRFVAVNIARGSALPATSAIDVSLQDPPPGISANALVFTPDLVSGRLAIRASAALTAGSEFDIAVLATMATGGRSVEAWSSLHVKVTPFVPSSQELIRTARKDGRIDLATSLLYRMYATVGDGRLPLEFRGEGTHEDSTLEYDIESNQAALPAAVATALRAHLVRPTDPASFWNAQAADLHSALPASAAKASVSAAPLLEQATCPTSGAKVTWIHQRSAVSPVRVWAQCVLGFADNNRRAESGIRYGIQYLDKIFPPMTAMMGPPLVDRGDGGLDPDPNIDLYIVPRFVLIERGTLYTLTPPELGTLRGLDVGLDPKRSGYLVLWDELLDLADGLAGFHSGLIHEFFHLLQGAHNRMGVVRHNPSTPDEWDRHWFSEASAKWAEVHFDRVIAWPARGAQGELEKQFELFQNNPDPLNSLINEAGYQAYIWPFYMTLKSGSAAGAAAVAAVWRALESVSPGEWQANPDAIDNALVSVFPYPSTLAQAGGYIAKQAKLEFGALTSQQPTGTHGITALLAQTPGVELASAYDDLRANVVAREITRTFWEKATILHAEHHRPLELPIRDGFARHYADFEALWRHPSRADALARLDLLEDVVRHQSRFFASAWTHYETARPGTFRLVPPPARHAALARDYATMAPMFIGEPVEFNAMLRRLRTAEQQLNDGSLRRPA